MMDFSRLGAAMAFLGVALGAFGAHALKGRLSAEMLHAWNVGVLYHLIHALALFALGLYLKISGPALNLSGWFFFAGIVLFSGSLYALALSGIKPLGAITPLGGLCFLAGWAWAVFKI